MYNQFDHVEALVTLTRGDRGEGGAVIAGEIGVITTARTECARGEAPCYTVLFSDGTWRYHMDHSTVIRVYPRVPWRRRAWWLSFAFAAGALARPFLENWIG